MWDGASWRIVPSASPGVFSILYGVSCANATSCVAVGRYFDGFLLNTLVETWDGMAWGVTPVPTRPVRPPTSSSARRAPVRPGASPSASVKAVQGMM
jgi:hypothetical protein